MPDHKTGWGVGVMEIKEKRATETACWIALVALVVLLQGCATQLSIGPGSASEDAQTPSAPMLRFQSNSIAPAAFLEREVLQPGDILLTAEPTLISASIRLVTFAPVSHAAVYVGDRQVVEAVRTGVRVRDLEEILAEATVALVLRYPVLTAEQAALIREYAVNKSGAGFNFLGITLNIPISISRRVCEVPFVSAAVRDACIRAMGVLHQLAPSQSELFCSQLVLQAYRHAGVPVTAADARLISPADILHMREGDVSSVKISKQLHYIGRLKYERPVTTLAFQE
jgi:Permuted papain-like amidase enzyme, YaeF/YiiX, C92 family